MLACSKVKIKPLKPCQVMSAKGLLYNVLLDYIAEMYINTLRPNCLCPEASATKHTVHATLL